MKIFENYYFKFILVLSASSSGSYVSCFDLSPVCKMTERLTSKCQNSLPYLKHVKPKTSSFPQTELVHQNGLITHGSDQLWPARPRICLYSDIHLCWHFHFLHLFQRQSRLTPVYDVWLLSLLSKVQLDRQVALGPTWLDQQPRDGLRMDCLRMSYL